MTLRQLINHRLTNQQLIRSDFTEPQQLVRWMGCIQAQDFAGGKWAIGNRINGVLESDIDRDFNEGRILRTHVLRPTWHFVTPEDIRWMLKLTAPGIKATSKTYHKKLGIDATALKRSKTIITKALRDGQHLTRDDLRALLKKGKINTSDIRFAFLILDAELDGIICSGRRVGKQFTYALLDERVRPAKPMDHDAALAEIGKRYFQSHGPATLQDFKWWSGLSLYNARKSIELNKKSLESTTIEGQLYWFSSDVPSGKLRKNTIHLLPVLDEYGVAYKNRTAILDPEYHAPAGNGVFKPTIIIDGRVAGIWKRAETKGKLKIVFDTLMPASKETARALRIAAETYATFTGQSIEKVNGIEFNAL